MHDVFLMFLMISYLSWWNGGVSHWRTFWCSGKNKIPQVLPNKWISNKFNIVQDDQDGVIGNTKCHLGNWLTALRAKESAEEIVGMTLFVHCFREWDANTCGINGSFICIQMTGCITLDTISREGERVKVNPNVSLFSDAHWFRQHRCSERWFLT